jgi:betaine-aldehyde dehydrogenase/succinate-semialdehyde dehydrogenase/glutarate-semialdehyde dehydrogenase
MFDTLRCFAGWTDKPKSRQIPTGCFMGRPMVNYTVAVPRYGT